MKNRRKFIFLLILGLLILSSPFIVSSQEANSTADTTDLYANNPDIQDLNQQIETNKTKIDNLKKATEEYAQKIEEFKNKAVSLKNQLGLLDNQITKAELDINTNQLEIDKTKLEIDSLDWRINKEQKEIEEQKNNLIEYIKQIDKSDRKSYLEILILNDSFAEFFNQISYLEQVQSDLKISVDRLKLLQNALTVQKADKERQKSDLEKLKKDLITKQDKLKDDLAAKENLLITTRSSEVQFQNLLIQAKQQQNEIDSEVLQLQEQVKNKIQRLRTENTSPQNTLVDWPIASREITAYFHDPDYPFRYVYEHPAIDIRTKQGTPIRAPAAGYVARTVDAGYGYSYIIIIHDNGISTVYGHVSAIYVKEDTYVKVGDIIGLTGALPGTRGAGRLTTGPHLHFEVRLNGIPVNPLEYLP